MRGPINYNRFSLSRFNFDIGGRWTLLTGVIVLVCAALFVYGYTNRTANEVRQASGETQPYRTFALYETLGLQKDALLKGELWRIVSSAFLHANIMQLICSAVLLYLFGAYLASRLGKFMFVVSFLICGITGGITSLLISPKEMYLCAPAASLGTATLCVSFFPYIRFFRSLSARQLLIPSVAIMLLSGATFTRSDIMLLGQFAGVPAAYILFRLVPYIQQVASRRRLRREIAGLFLESQKEEELDRILKKVGVSGMDSLTQPEKRFLQTMSSEYQKKRVEQNR